MASSSRRTPPSLEKVLYSESSHFAFHAAMKLISTMKFEISPANPVVRFFDELVYIQVKPTFERPATDIFSLEKPGSARPVPTMNINFMGIETRQGPLPDPYIEQVIRACQRGDFAFHAFLSIFNNRIIHLFHNIRKKYWIGISLSPPEDTPYGKLLKSLVGLNGKHLVNRLKVPDRSLLYYTGFFWQKPRSCCALEKLLKHFFNVPIKLEQMIGTWTPIPYEQRSSIGITGNFNKLGDTSITGSRFWNQQHFFRLKVGPINISTFINFLKPGPMYQEMISLTEFYIGKHQDFQIQLILNKDEVPETKLGRGAALAWTTWLKNKPFTKDADQVILNNNPHFRPEANTPMTLS